MYKVATHCQILLLMFMQTSVIFGHDHTASTTASTEYMQPIQKDGKYYYGDTDTHEHINVRKALTFLARKMLSPTELLNAITSMFYPAESKSDPVALLNPTTTKPVETSSELKITWVGHSMFLIQINDFNILTDPIMHDVMVGPLVLTKRGMPAGIRFEDLPMIDAILISHDHSDHMDTTTLTALNKRWKPMILVPTGNGHHVKAMGFDDERIIERNWWQDYTLEQQGNRSVTFTGLPAYHWSARFSLDSYRQALWSGWMISANDKHIYFAGDTAYGPHFKQIAQRFPLIDVALMPIGPTHEGENKHAHSHTDAPEAVQAFIDLNAQYFIPMHYATFFISKDTVEHPVRRLYESWQQAQLDQARLIFARCGQIYSI
jgi:L-ascorbate metabolism protein UlaG (beta-lactamase superfamily)